MGYGKPPRHPQFQPGQSGNPKGRPKGAKGLFTLLREELQRKVKLGENGTVTTVTRAEAVVRRVAADTLGGKASQTKLLFSLFHGLETQDGRNLYSDLTESDRHSQYRTINPKGSKEDRLAACSAIIEEGRVYLPESADWLPAFLSEVTGVPSTRHDD